MREKKTRSTSVLIPEITLLERKPPVVFTSRLALREGNAKKPIYQLHKWWARRLGSVFRTILIGVSKRADSKVDFEAAFYRKQNYAGFVVLDPFVGGGTSVVEAAKCGASVVGIDIDPVACFVTRAELQGCNLKDISGAFDRIAESVRDRIRALYMSKLPDGTASEIVYAFWVEVARCGKCNEHYPAHPHYQLVRDPKNSRQTVFCKYCNEIHELNLRRRRFNCERCNRETQIASGNAKQGRGTCPGCGHEQVLHDRNVEPENPPEHILFALQVIDAAGKVHFKKADDADLAIFDTARRLWSGGGKNNSFVPDELIPTAGRSDPRPICFGYRRYRDLFNERQLLALSLIAHAIADLPNGAPKELLATAFSDCLASNNMFCYYAFDYDKLTPLFGLHAYHKVTRPVENNVWGSIRGRGSFEKCYKKLLRAKEFATSPFEYRYSRRGQAIRVRTGESINVDITSEIDVHNGRSSGVLLNTSSEHLGRIQGKSIDLILSDPPYYDNLAYSELSDFYHVWLKRLQLPSYAGNDRAQTPISESLYVGSRNSRPDRDHAVYQSGLCRILRECNRILKDDGIMIFTFHHRSEAAWRALGNALIHAHFRVTNVFPIRSEGTSQFHSSAGNLKWDAVFCCRKRKGDSSGRQSNCADRAIKLTNAWSKKLRAAKLAFNEVDRVNLNRALAAMDRCNAGIVLGEQNDEER